MSGLSGQGTGVPASPSGHSPAGPRLLLARLASVPNAAHARLRFAFETAMKALLNGDSDDVTLPRTAFTPLLDYVGFREFTFAAAARRRDEQSDMSDLISLASAYRNAKAENAAAFDEMEKAHTDYDAATARWEASGNFVATARKALLEHAASAIDARSAETGNTDSARQGESATRKGDAHD